MRILLKWVLLAFLLVVVFRNTLEMAGRIPFDDFLAYWSAARLQLGGQDPYALDNLQRVEATVGFKEAVPYMMWYPPWVFPLILPFGLVGYTTGRALWMLTHFFLLILCVSVLWRFYGGTQKNVWVAWVLALMFAPTFFVLRNGQMAAVLLAGAVGFLCFEKAKKNWLTGVSLYLLGIKPHLAYLFWLVLSVWIIQRKRWTILMAAVFSLAVACVLPLPLNPYLIVQSLHAQTSLPPFYWATPTIGTILRLIFGPEKFYLQWGPTVIMVCLLTVYWSAKQRDWNWEEELPLLLGFGLFTTIYSWASDLVLLLPLIMQVAVRLVNQGGRAQLRIAAGCYVLINAVAFLMNLSSQNGAYYVWFAPAVLAGGYFYQRRFGNFDAGLHDAEAIL
ncbi:MAG: glycosyltransferase family 87 protein [Terriglobia bacterium]